MHPGRIAAQVVSGIGFLGAEPLRGRSNGKGIDTAAGLWVVACIGWRLEPDSIPVIGTTVLILFVLIYFAKFGRKIHRNT